MCEPTYYDINYEINPWMNKKIKANHLKAMSQWEQLVKTIQSVGAEVVLVEPQKGWPDMVFTANAGLVKNKKILLSDFRYSERQGEKHFFAQWFIKAGYDLIETVPETKNHYFEGEGDALFSPLFSRDRLFVGFGFRSDKAFYANVKPLGILDLIYCELVDPYFYHLDTCFCPLNNNSGIWWRNAFTPDSQKQMLDVLDLINVPEDEAKHFACNAVVIGNTVIIPSDCPKTKMILTNLGYTVLDCEMSEFIKAGGACKCLTLFI